jgi:transposase-like protein
MATGSKKSLPQSSTVPELVQNEVEQVLQSGSADFSIRQLLGFLISNAGVAERKLYLEKTADDQPNGFYERRLEVGATPVEIRVSRTRRRVPPGNIASEMGLSSSEDELEQVAAGFVDELQLRNSRSLDPDLVALFVDGKYVEWREGDKLRPATIYVAVGLGRDGKKQVLACLPQPGREHLEGWKVLIRGLCERGLSLPSIPAGLRNCVRSGLTISRS